MSKVYTGLTTIEEHIKQLDMPDWIPHEERKARLVGDEIIEPRKQSIEIQRLKREAGLV
jgi:hypothetical protein